MRVQNRSKLRTKGAFMFKRLTLRQRYQIKDFLEAGFSQAEVAVEVGVDKSTISREIKRNRGPDRYDPEEAQRKSEIKQKFFHRHETRTTAMTIFIKEKLAQKWSPEQICGYCRKNKISMISTEAIYQYIAKDRKERGSLYLNLRRQGKKKKKYGSYSVRGQIKDRRIIDDRPKIVDEKIRFGDFEGDLVIGKGHSGAIVTLVDRLTKLTLAKPVPNKSAQAVTAAIIELLYPFVGLLKTLTFDNGKEFSFHKKLEQILKLTVYFAHPYSSWERGLNENTNGLIRQYLPKKMCFKGLLDSKVLKITENLNSRPRKLLDFATPMQVFEKTCLNG